MHLRLSGSAGHSIQASGRCIAIFQLVTEVSESDAMNAMEGVGWDTSSTRLHFLRLVTCGTEMLSPHAIVLPGCFL